MKLVVSQILSFFCLLFFIHKIRSVQSFIIDPYELVENIVQDEMDDKLHNILNEDNIKYNSSHTYDDLRRNNILNAIKMKNHEIEDPILDYVNNQVLKDQMSHFRRKFDRKIQRQKMQKQEDSESDYSEGENDPESAQNQVDATDKIILGMNMDQTFGD